MHRDLIPIIVRPFWYRSRLMDIKFTFLNQNANQCIGDTFGHRPSHQPGIFIEAGCILFTYDLIIVNHYDSMRIKWTLGIRFKKSVVKSLLNQVILHSGIN